MSARLVPRAEVRRTERLSPGMVRIVFGGAGLDGFTSTGVGDEYLRVFFPQPGTREPVLPNLLDDGGWEFADGVDPAPLRTYTVRDWQPESGELTIDFVVHDGGIAAAWAAAARPGDAVGVNLPRGLYAAPAELDWQLLIADATGMPAALRLAEASPEGVRTRVVLEVASAADELDVSLRGGVDLHWVHGGNGHGPTRIEDIVRAAELPDGAGYVWVAGETKATRGVRRYLRHELKLPATAYKVVGYWSAEGREWFERYERLPDQVRANLAAMWQDSARDEEEIQDEYDAELEKYGL